MDIVKQYEELLKLDPASIAFAPLAEELCYRGFWEDALKLCRQGLAHHPRHLRGRVLLGWALKELGEYAEAEEALMEAEAEIQKNALLFRLLGELARKAGDSNRAERLLLIHKNLQPGPATQVPAPSVEAAVPPPVVTSPEPEAATPPGPSVAGLLETQAVTSPGPLPAVSLPETPPVTPLEPHAELSPVAIPELPPEAPKEEVTTFLASLLERYEALPTRSVAEQRLFTEDDRRTLSRILKSLRR